MCLLQNRHPQQQQHPQAATASQMRRALIASWDLSDPLLQSTSVSSFGSTDPISEASAGWADQDPACAPSASSSSLSTISARQPLRRSAKDNVRQAAAAHSVASSSLSSEPSSADAASALQVLGNQARQLDRRLNISNALHAAMARLALTDTRRASDPCSRHDSRGLS